MALAAIAAPEIRPTLEERGQPEIIPLDAPWQGPDDAPCSEPDDAPCAEPDDAPEREVADDARAPSPAQARLLRLPLARVKPKRVEAPAWSLSTLSGRLVELSSVGASAALSFTALLLHEAQRQGEPVAWVQGRDSLFHPPDLAATGVDLRALPILRPAAPGDLGKIVGHLLRSGAFGLIVVDLSHDEAERALPAPLQSRLERTAALHGTCVLCLTDKAADTGSLGPLVSWRGEARRVTARGAAIRAEVVALKDKRSAPGWHCAAEFERVAGLT